MIFDEMTTLLLAGFAGFFIGAIFFGGLWWTVNRGVTAKHPALWFLGSMIARMGIVLTGFYFIGGGSWQRLLIALLGFICARLIVVWLTRPMIERSFRLGEESHHAT